MNGNWNLVVACDRRTALVATREPDPDVVERDGGETLHLDLPRLLAQVSGEVASADDAATALRGGSEQAAERFPRAAIWLSQRALPFEGIKRSWLTWPA